MKNVAPGKARNMGNWQMAGKAHEYSNKMNFMLHLT
jgi:hypothetical protein